LYGSLPLIKADVEIYHLGDQMYQKDVYTKKWILIPAQSREGIEQLIAELNPLSIFNFSEDNWEIKEAGKERIDGKGCYVYEVMTRGENKYLQLFWKDFNYILWVDKKEGLLRQAKISAEHRERSDHRLTIEVKLTDYNVPIELTPPV
jgi:negative regulator of sigma E activity